MSNSITKMIQENQRTNLILNTTTIRNETSFSKPTETQLIRTGRPDFLDIDRSIFIKTPEERRQLQIAKANHKANPNNTL